MAHAMITTVVSSVALSMLSPAFGQCCGSGHGQAMVAHAGGGTGHGAHGAAAPIARQPVSQPATIVNDVCPIRGKEVDPEAPTRVWRGQTIGFCCEDCDAKWDEKSEAEKDEFLAKFVRVAAPSPAVALAQKYQAALGAGELGAIDGLFLAGATILENGGDEGTWERYRDEHLKPEMEELAGYRWTTALESEVKHGSASIVRQVGSFAIGAGAEEKRFRAAVTFVVVEDGGTSKIAHMHWSSRQERKPATPEHEHAEGH